MELRFNEPLYNEVLGIANQFPGPSNTRYYYVAVSHKDWELPNSWIWLVEIDIESGLDFPI